MVGMFVSGTVLGLPWSSRAWSWHRPTAARHLCSRCCRLALGLPVRRSQDFLWPRPDRPERAWRPLEARRARRHFRCQPRGGRWSDWGRWCARRRSPACQYLQWEARRRADIRGNVCTGQQQPKLDWRYRSLTLSLPRVINFKFLLQPHKEYFSTQYWELGFS